MRLGSALSDRLFPHNIRLQAHELWGLLNQVDQSSAKALRQGGVLNHTVRSLHRINARCLTCGIVVNVYTKRRRGTMTREEDMNCETAAFLTKIYIVTCVSNKNCLDLAMRSRHDGGRVRNPQNNHSSHPQPHVLRSSSRVILMTVISVSEARHCIGI